MRRLSGFSLMEMMIVLLIIAVVAAASAPMINKRMLSNASEKSPWVWTGTRGNIAFNLTGDENNSVVIGQVEPPENIAAPSLYIGGNNAVKLAFDDGSGGALGFVTGNNNMAFGNVTGNPLQGLTGCTLWGAGASARGDHAVAIGDNGNFANEFSVSIGHRADANSPNSIAIGRNFRTENNAIGIITNPTNDLKVVRENSIIIGSNPTIRRFGAHIAIGSNVQVDSDFPSIAIGNGALANNGIAIGGGAQAMDGCAIGSNARNTRNNQIILGNDTDNPTAALQTTVYIPGNLVVDGNVYLGRSEDSRVYMALPRGDTGSTTELNLMWHDGGNYVKRTGGYAYNSVPLTSDRRLKNVGKPFVAGLEEIKKLEVFNFTYKKDKTNTPRVGVMAQDLQKIFPKAVTKGDDGFLMIRMEDMFYAMVNAIKELANKFDIQDKRIKELEKQNADLLKRIEALEKKVK